MALLFSELICQNTYIFVKPYEVTVSSLFRRQFFLFLNLFFKSFFSGHVIYFLKGDLPGSTRLVMEFQNIEGLVSNTPPKLEFSKIGGAISSQVFKVVVKKNIFLEPPMDICQSTQKKFLGCMPPKIFY